VKVDTIVARHNETGIAHRFRYAGQGTPRWSALCGYHIVYEFKVHEPWGWVPVDAPVTCIRCAVADAPDAVP